MGNIPEHLRFAFYYAREALEHLVWGFDFEREAGRHTSTEIDPYHRLRVINGFLEHEKDTLDRNTILRLQEIKVIFETRLIPLYEQGTESALQTWLWATVEEKAKLESLDNEEIRDKARNLAPDTLRSSELSWFMEGFCYQWGQEWFQYVVWTFAQDMEEDDAS